MSNSKTCVHLLWRTVLLQEQLRALKVTRRGRTHQRGHASLIYKKKKQLYQNDKYKKQSQLT